MKKYLFFCFAVAFWAAPFSFGESPEDLLEEIDQAIDAEFYDRALSLLGQGEQVYPGDARFPHREGELYSSRELYNLALDSFFQAEQLEPNNRDIRKSIASTLGFLDRNEEALTYLESLLDDGSDYRIVDDLGWLYFKTHQPEKGIPLLEEALEKEFRRSLSLTLGTLYSEVNNQELCRKYYLDAIEDALEMGDNYFASVAYYNLSLAEQSFYSYEKAIEYAKRSVEQMDRAGGHLALGDLYQMKGNYSDAVEEFMKADPLDETPLSTMSLASFYRLSGELKTALQLANSIKASPDDSWMYYYGIDSIQFDTDLAELYKDIYKGLYHTEALSAARGWGDTLRRWGRIGKYFGLFRYYDAQFRLLSFRGGKVQWERSTPLRGALSLAASSEGHPHTALKYIRIARDLESEFPESAAWYDLEIGRETDDLSLLHQAARSFQKEWEAGKIEESYREILLREKGARYDAEKLEAAAAIFRQNPGGLKQYGLRLPLYLDVTGTESSRLIRLLKKRIALEGVFFTPEYMGREPVLRVHYLPDESLAYTVTWPDGTLEVSEKIAIRGGLGDAVYRLSESFAESIFP